jgi:hypothetical protein
MSEGSEAGESVRALIEAGLFALLFANHCWLLPRPEDLARKQIWCTWAQI